MKIIALLMIQILNLSCLHFGGGNRFLVGNKLVMQRKWGKLFIQSKERRGGWAKDNGVF